jgi:transposase-like protein
MNYDRDFKLKAVLLSYENGSLAQTARELQIGKNLLFLWRKEFKKYGTGCFPGCGNLTLTSDEKKIYNLEKKIRETDLKFEIIQKAAKHIGLGKPFIFHFMAENEKKYSIKLLCRTLRVNRGTYRTWKRGLITQTQQLRINLKKEISSIFSISKQTYGCHRIAAELQKSGYTVCPTTVLKLMRELGIYVSIKKNNPAVRTQ